MSDNVILLLCTRRDAVMITETAALCKFIRGFDTEFYIHEALTSICSWKATIEKDLFLTVKETFASLNWTGKKN